MKYITVLRSEPVHIYNKKTMFIFIFICSPTMGKPLVTVLRKHFNRQNPRAEPSSWWTAMFCCHLSANNNNKHQIKFFKNYNFTLILMP